MTKRSCFLFSIAARLDSEPRRLLHVHQSAPADRGGQHPLHGAGAAGHRVRTAAGDDRLTPPPEHSAQINTTAGPGFTWSEPRDSVCDQFFIFQTAVLILFSIHESSSDIDRETTFRNFGPFSVVYVQINLINRSNSDFLYKSLILSSEMFCSFLKFCFLKVLQLPPWVVCIHFWSAINNPEIYLFFVTRFLISWWTAM